VPDLPLFYFIKPHDVQAMSGCVNADVLRSGHVGRRTTMATSRRDSSVIKHSVSDVTDTCAGCPFLNTYLKVFRNDPRTTPPFRPYLTTSVATTMTNQKLCWWNRWPER